MMGWFSRSAHAAKKHRTVVVPTTGLTAIVRPTATVSAIFSGERPCVSCSTIGSAIFVLRRACRLMGRRPGNDSARLGPGHPGRIGGGDQAFEDLGKMRARLFDLG